MTKALEKTYDGIIIGAGQHGMVLRLLSGQGRPEYPAGRSPVDYGGGLMTREATLPGFYHNLHSINHFQISATPWFEDLELDERVTYITPPYEFAQAHRDGSALVFGRDREETLANVARFSKRDAATFREWNRSAEEMTRANSLPERYAEPLPQEEREALLSQCAIGRDFLAITRRQPFDVVQELFENEHVKLLFLFKVSLFGTWLTDTLSKTSPMGSVIRAFDFQSGYQLCRGGSFNLARGLMETFHRRRRDVEAAGGDRPHVVEGGTRDRHRACRRPHGPGEQFVASTIDVHQTFEKHDRARSASRGIWSPSSTNFNTPIGPCSGFTWRSMKARALPRRRSTRISTGR